MRPSAITCALLLAACAGIAGCGAPAGPADGNPDTPRPPIAHDTTPAGYESLYTARGLRLYRLHVPAHLPNGTVPLLLALHGYSSNARDMEGVGFDALADTAGFIVAYPEGCCEPHMWNAGGPYDLWSGSMDDVGFIHQLIETLAARYPIDLRRVFATGHSNGGYMVYRLAHELSYALAGVAPVAGSEFVGSYAPPGVAIGIIHIHALDDAMVPFMGGEVGGVGVRPVPYVLERWRELQACTLPPDTLMNAGGVLGVRWHCAAGQGDIALYTAATGGHVWPTRSLNGLEARDVIWSFFRSLTPRSH